MLVPPDPNDAVRLVLPPAIPGVPGADAGSDCARLTPVVSEGWRKRLNLSSMGSEHLRGEGDERHRQQRERAPINSLETAAKWLRCPLRVSERRRCVWRPAADSCGPTLPDAQGYFTVLRHTILCVHCRSLSRNVNLPEVRGTGS